MLRDKTSLSAAVKMEMMIKWVYMSRMLLQFWERFKIRLIRLMVQQHQPTGKFNDNINASDEVKFSDLLLE